MHEEAWIVVRRRLRLRHADVEFALLVGDAESGVRRAYRLHKPAAEALLDAGVDVLVVDSAHGHSRNVVETVKELKRRYTIDVIAGDGIGQEVVPAAIECLDRAAAPGAAGPPRPPACWR